MMYVCSRRQIPRTFSSVRNRHVSDAAPSSLYAKQASSLSVKWSSSILGNVLPLLPLPLFDNGAETTMRLPAAKSDQRADQRSSSPIDGAVDC